MEYETEINGIYYVLYDVASNKYYNNGNYRLKINTYLMENKLKLCMKINSCYYYHSRYYNNYIIDISCINLLNYLHIEKYVYGLHLLKNLSYIDSHKRKYGKIAKKYYYHLLQN